MTVITLNHDKPRIAPSCFLSKTAVVIGRVTIGSDSSLWPGSVVRGDEAGIKIGKRVNVQDNCVIHADHAHPVRIGDDVTIGHAAILHSCKVLSRVIIGMQSVVLNDAVIGSNSILGAGSLVTGRTVIPPRSLVYGCPAKKIRSLASQEIAGIIGSARDYASLAHRYRKSARQRVF